MPGNESSTPLIVRVIDPYASLVKNGDYFLGYCPLCRAVPPRMVVRPEIAQWHCYDCGAGGDVEEFLAAAEQVSVEEARELLAAFEGRGVQVFTASEVQVGEQPVDGPDAKILRGLVGKLSTMKGFRGALVLRADGTLAASTNCDPSAFAPLEKTFDALLAGSQKILGGFSPEGAFVMVGVQNAMRKLLRIHTPIGEVPCIVLLELDPDANDALFSLGLRSYLAHLTHAK